VEDLREFNPMLGHRGCRLGITYPEITEMQARTIVEAALELKAEELKHILNYDSSYWCSEEFVLQRTGRSVIDKVMEEKV
jgi:pyruvate,orthophosphate dikinase